MLTEFRYIAQFYGNPVQYQDLIEKIINFLLRFDFDGLDIVKQGFYDFKKCVKLFQFQGTVTNNQIIIISVIFSQSARHVSTVNELHKRFKLFNLQLTISWGIKDGDQSYLALSKYIDYMSFLGSTGYYSSSEEAISDLHIMNMEKRINEITSNGFPSSKLVMNVDFVGYPIRRSDSDQFLGGQWPFNQVCKLTSNDESSIWNRHFHTAANLAILRNKNEETQFREVIFQSTRSIANLARLAMKFGLAGLSAVPINFDDFRGNCGIGEDTFDDFKPSTKFSTDILKRKFPLLRTINVSINVTLHEIQNDTKPINNSSGNRLSNFFCNFFHLCC